MSIANFCSKEIIMIPKDASIQETAQRMKENNVGAVVVVENGKPLGVITDRDVVVEVVANGVGLDEVSAKDILAKDVLILKKEQGVHEAIKAMKDKHVRRAPVVDYAGKICGMVSMDDLLVLLAHELQDLAQLVEGQLERHTQ